MLTIGVIDTQLYSILVMMALVTTAMTAPLLTAFGVQRPISPENGTSREAKPCPEGRA